MKIIGAFSLIILLMMSGIAPILVNSLPNKIGTTSVENVSPLLVMFGDSEAEIAARDQLLQNFPNSNIIDFNVDKQQIIEYTGPVIYIGHSSEEGISYNNQLVQWSFLSAIIGQSVSNNHYILGCNSQTISELTAQTGKNVISFDFEIDAIWAANFISILIGNEEGLSTFIYHVFANTLNRINDILSGEKILPMGFSNSENLQLFIMGFFTFMAVLLPITLGVAVAIGSATFWYYALAVGKAASFLAALAYAFENPRNLAAWTAVLTSLVYALAAYSALSSAMAADQASWPVRWPAAVVSLVAAVGSTVYFLYFYKHDNNDCNGIPAKDEPGALTFDLDPNAGCSSSPPPPPGII